jgi:hypothetical protein
MAATHSRRRLVLTTAVAVAAFALSACTAVVDGAAVAGDRGPCTHVDAPMLDVPTSNSSEPRMRIPEVPGWQRDPETEDLDPNIRLALSNTDAARGNTVAVMISELPDAEPATIFDNFEAGLVEGLELEGQPTDVTRIANTLCGLPSETITFGAADSTTGAVSTMAVVAQSGGETYLIAVVPAVDPEDPAQLRDAETILTGFEVLPQDATAA